MKWRELLNRQVFPSQQVSAFSHAGAFRELLERGAAKILNPDPCHVGGIFETRLIAGMAEMHYAGVAPHCPLGPIALATCLQLDAMMPNFVSQEHVTLGEGYLKEPFVPVEWLLANP